MESTLVSLSNDLARIVQELNRYVFAVHARRHFPSGGVHWRTDVVVTADHSIQRQEEIQVTLPDSRTAEATLIGRDAGTDLALLKVEGLGAPDPVLGQAESVRAGELALVLGRSPNSGPNASLGIISAASGPWRTWRGGHLDQYLRLDATLFPNSSGGAVVNVSGKIIGVATSALSRIAGLAIPASTVNRVVNTLLEKGLSRAAT